MTKLRRALALVGAGALVVGVAVAFAGVPHLSYTDSTFDSGTTTKGGGKNTTTLATALTSAAASSSSSGYAPATIYVHFGATGVSGTPFFVPSAAGTATWACGNTGGGFPSDPKKTTAPLDPIANAESLGADRKGKITYNGSDITITIVPPAAFTCPTGQTALLVQLTLTSLQLAVYEYEGGPLQITWNVDYPADFVNGTWTRPGWTG